MFVDNVTVDIAAGNGGDGLISFRHEKFIDKGGPNGGDGGNGGDVVLIASTSENTLARFRYDKKLTAEHGEKGKRSNQHGKSGEDLLLAVPVGTLATRDDGVVMADMVEDGQRTVIARGGKGGFGNAHFKSSTRQAPLLAEKGEPGERYKITLELKMIADIGLVGLPNAGKSTLLASISNARPEIANYPFTTLQPNLGVVDIDKKHSLLVADIPGLIEGASQGKGLGDEFLRHIERTKVLVHLIDAWQDNLAAAYKTVQSELAAYSANLVKKPQIVTLSKIDGMDSDMVADRLKELRSALPAKTKPHAISAHSKQGVNELLFEAIKLAIVEQRKAERAARDKPIVLRLEEPEQAWLIQESKGGFLVTGRKIERFAQRTDFNNFHAQQRLRDILKKMGIMHELEKRGIKLGEKITIGRAGIGTLEY